MVPFGFTPTDEVDDGLRQNIWRARKESQTGQCDSEDGVKRREGLDTWVGVDIVARELDRIDCAERLHIARG
jgi:hypothetical protein